MDDVEQRLKDATAACLTGLEAWRKNEKDKESREQLMANVHDLRKVAARLEIEMAISERDQMVSNRPIQIPSHRSSQKKRSGGGQPQQKNDQGANKKEAAPKTQQNKKPTGKLTTNKPAASGGSDNK